MAKELNQNSTLIVDNISKTFGSTVAVDDVSFSVREGIVFGLLGKNGAGKTTTIRIMLNIYQADKGIVSFNDAPIDGDFRQYLGYLPEERGLYKDMRVMECILFFAKLNGKSASAVKEKAEGYLSRLELLDRQNHKVESLSKGNQQKVQLICAIIHEPKFIVLDEPFSGLDPVNIKLFTQLISELKAQGRVVILSTHLLDIAEQLCDDVVIINKGRVLLNGAVDDIKKRYSAMQAVVQCDAELADIQKLSAVAEAESIGRKTEVRLCAGFSGNDLLTQLIADDVQLDYFETNEISLNKIFIDLVTVGEGEQ